MRYLIAIIFAIVGAAVAMQFLSGPVANWAALQFKFDSSDDAENMNQMVFMIVNLAGLVVGWTIGWAIGGPLSGGQRPQ
jgi:putative Ca2+/H+ antiporter (TMEM165/GDT1 family)